MGKSSKQPATQTQKTEPWEKQQPHLETQFNQAEQIYNTNQQNNVGGQAVQGMYELAKQGAPGIQNAGNMLGQTVQGDFLQGNPYLNNAINTAMRPAVRNFQSAVMPGLQAGWASAGRHGSPGMARAIGNATESLGRSLGDMATDMSYRNYTTERQNQMQAAGMMPAMNAAAYSPFERMLQAENASYNNLNNYASLIGGGYGSSGTTQQHQPENKGSPLSGALGGAAAGASLGPWGAAGGAVLGGLSGLL